MRLLFITSNRLGDAVLSTSVLRHYVETYPGIRVTVACGPVAAPIFEGVPNLERIIKMPKQKRGGHWWKLWKSVVLNWWEIIVDLRGSATAYVLPGRKRVVLPGNDDDLHRVEQLGKLIGVEPAPLPMIWTCPEDEARAEQLIPDDGKALLAVGPSANWGGKTWPADRFVDLIARIRANDGLLPNAHLLVVGAPSERDAAKPVIDSLKAEDRTVIFGDEHLLTVQACLERSDLYVGNDSGLMHMAAAAGIPTLGLFGPTREDNYGPCGPITAHVRTDKSFEEIWKAGEIWRSHESQMDSLPVEKVFDAARALLARKNGAIQ
ncbi:glycosyltransferase family 9 protein [Thalassospira sp.]|uniref:glycosyltransferase family 9 protein n=1 Tax=Thalassospira sp. TaxID=1912094 RepID=UPI000C5A172F|nr:glycosyltransferase family 9 protein [Thalassospira sp.]MBC06411.1 glycosyl transferase [Thalassospira sp.]